MSANPDPQRVNFSSSSPAGILLVDKPVGKTAFSLVAALRKILKVRKIGHAGTLDPFATGVMVMLIGREMTKLSDQFLCADKEYVAQLYLGITTDSFDCDGSILNRSDLTPTQDEIEGVIQKFQGQIEQIPPMFSAKKVNGKKLYELARKGKVIERQPSLVTLETKFLSYNYPYLELQVKCSKGTYVRSIAEDMGKLLGCGAHLSALRRIRSGPFKIEDCLDGSILFNQPVNKEDLPILECGDLSPLS